MHLTLQTDYALRVLLYLAADGDRTARIADIAAGYGISRNHLLKVALRLSKLGYVTTLRGRSGGVVLAQRPEDIKVGDVVRQMEDDLALVECMCRDGGACVISRACRLEQVVRKALDAFLAVFDEYTLADIAANRGFLAQVLALDVRRARKASAVK